MGNEHEGGHDHSGHAGHEYVVFSAFVAIGNDEQAWIDYHYGQKVEDIQRLYGVEVLIVGRETVVLTGVT